MNRSMSARAAAATGLAAALALTSSAAFAAGGPPEPRKELQRSAEAVVKAGAVGHLIRVDDGHHVRTATAGLADRQTQRRLKNKDQFQAGSQTKTFVSVLVLQLAAQGKVNLDAPVEKYLPGVVPNGANITVRMLLQHTSGLFNYTEDNAKFEELLQQPTTVVEPQFLLSVAFAHDPYFAPGQGWHYSNTGYVVLGELLEKVTGTSVRELIQQRITKPLRLRDTYLADPFVEDTGPGYAHGYGVRIADGKLSYTDTSEWTLSWAGSAGAIVSTSRDLSTFYSALLSGKVLPPAQLAEMKKTVDISAEFGVPIEVGLGLFEQETPCGTIWGHDGGTLGHSTATFVSSDGERSLSGDTNVALLAAADPEDPALAKFSNALGEAQMTAICAMFGKEVPAEAELTRPLAAVGR